MNKQSSFEEAEASVMAFLAARGWEKQPPRSLATSIVLEAAELLEHYQWQSTPVGDKDELSSELADILIYVLHFAHLQKIDLPAAIEKKLERQGKKYPVKAFENTSKKDFSKEWIKLKTKYKKKGL